uniref:Uncharacterized protein n=1 Tax=Plectus sambesii TaxID=2011161 RepID=A0A914VJU5_9BILA
MHQIVIFAIEWADWCSGIKPSLINLEDAGSILAEGGPSANQGAHPSVGRGIGSSFAAKSFHAANIPVTGMRRPTGYSTVAIHMAGSHTHQQKADAANSGTNAKKEGKK